MPILHCSKCHHEWEGRYKSTCDWCGAEARVLKDKSELEQMIEKLRDGQGTSGSEK